MNPAEADIRRLLGQYFDMLHHCDIGLLRRVFHPEALYATADEADLLLRRMPAYEAVIAAREPPAVRGEPRRDFIEHIEIAGANTALARVRCSFGQRDFVDFLSLVRVDGRWQVIAKVFHFTENHPLENACPT